MTQTPDPARSMRIIWHAITGGALLFLVVVPFADVTPQRPPDDPLMQNLGWIGVGIGVVLAVTAMVLRPMLVRRAAAASGEATVAAAMTAMLVPLAMLEGAVLLQATCWLITGAPVPSAYAGGLFLLMTLLVRPRSQQAPVDLGA